MVFVLLFLLLDFFLPLSVDDSLLCIICVRLLSSLDDRSWKGTGIPEVFVGLGTGGSLKLGRDSRVDCLVVCLLLTSVGF